MCACTDIIEAICSSIIIPFRYESLQNIQADVCLASENPVMTFAVKSLSSLCLMVGKPPDVGQLRAWSTEKE